jgi:hypothetical protein
MLYGDCTIGVSPIHLDSVDGLCLSERFNVHTVLSYILDDFEDEFFNEVNLSATTGAALRCPESGRMILASGLSVFEEDAEALNSLYGHLIEWSSIVQSLSIQKALRDRFGTDFLGEKSDVISLPGHDVASYWDAQEFAYATKMMNSVGIFCNASEAGLAAELPWDEGAVSAVNGDRTSLLYFDTRQTHPTAGNGLRFTLRLPHSGRPENNLALAQSLNVLDMSGVDIPPAFGAWAVGGSDDGLVYGGFWPNCMFRPGTVANIASWCMIRNRVARQFIGNQS